jgi:catechol 2,3-dioxygenase-like lactoylglutathione lyase family enzyme
MEGGQKLEMEKTYFDKVHHFGILVKNLENAKAHLALLGIGPFLPPKHGPPFIKTTFNGKPADFWNERLVATMGGMEIELFTPQGNAPSLTQFLKTKGDGIHHISFIVDDLDKELKKRIKQGANELESARWEGGGGFVYLTDPGGGINIELIQF